ncbi:MAG: ABC transporter permease [Leptothrix sp. (in: b-proteobacteria)]
MTALWHLAWRSAWNRRFVLGLVVASIALSTLLLLGIERIRQQVHDGFAESVSGTDLIVGARTGPVQLLLQAVFHLGSATQNLRWTSAEAVAQMKRVAWTVPIALGDSHRGFAVVGTNAGYFAHLRFGAQQPLALAQGRLFSDAPASIYDTVLGADVAARLGYHLGDTLVLSHGDGAFEANEHADKPYRVVGILAPTGTPVDRALHVPLGGIEAMHLDFAAGVRLPGHAVSAEQARAADLTPQQLSAVLVGLTTRAAAFAVQRRINEFEAEPLMAVLPGVALDELWSVVGVAEQGLLAVSALVSVVSLAGLVAVILAGLNERRRELAILRAVGCGPGTMLALLATEGALVTLAGVLLGTLGGALLLRAVQDSVLRHTGIGLHLSAPTATEWMLLGAVLLGGLLASLVPGWRAYRLSLADGLTPRN